MNIQFVSQYRQNGDRHAGRICPGKDIALKMSIDVISTVGKARRTKIAQT